MTDTLKRVKNKYHDHFTILEGEYKGERGHNCLLSQPKNRVMNKIKSFSEMWELIYKAAIIAKRRQKLLVTKKLLLGDGIVLIIGTSSSTNIEGYILPAKVFNEFDTEQNATFNEYFSR